MLPVRHVHDNLLFTDSGVVWALWQVKARSARHAAVATQLGMLGLAQAALLNLEGEPLLFSLSARRSREQLTDAMVGSVDVERHPAWGQATQDHAQIQHELGAYRRTHWLAMPLSSSGLKQTLRASSTAVTDRLMSSLGLPPSAIPAARLHDAVKAAAAIERDWPSTLPLQPATPAQAVWVFTHAASRGSQHVPAFPDRLDTKVPGLSRVRGDVLTGARFGALHGAVVYEGGMPGDDVPENLRKVLRVDTEEGTSWQCLLTASDLPDNYLAPSPKANWLAAVDELDFPVDWAVRLDVVTNEAARAKVRRALRELTDQVNEWSEEPTGAPPALAAALGTLGDLDSELSSGEQPPLLRCIVMFAVGGTTAAEAIDRGQQLRAVCRRRELVVQRPSGGQQAIWQAMQPCYLTSPAVLAYRQFLMCRDLAAAGPFLTADVGDPTGMPLLYSSDSGTLRPVLLDLASALREGRSASIGIEGDSGSGKSWMSKSIQWNAIACGYQIISIDTTHSGERATFARALDCRTRVVRADDAPQVSVDPLRLFDTVAGTTIAENYLAVMLGTSSLEAGGRALGAAVRAAAHSLERTMAMVLPELQRINKASPDPDVKKLIVALQALMDIPQAEAVFNPSLPAIDPEEVDYLLFHLPELKLPKREQLATEEGRRRLRPEQVWSQGLIYLVAAITKEIAFSSPRITLLDWDEKWKFDSTPEGEELSLEGVRDGRKHKTAVLLADQAVRTLGSDAVRGLIPYRITLGHDDDALAAEAAEWLGAANDPAVISMIKKLNSELRAANRSSDSGSGAPSRVNGQALLRTRQGELVRGLTVSPPYAHIREAMLTNLRDEDTA